MIGVSSIVVMLACSATSPDRAPLEARYRRAVELSQQNKLGPASEELELLALKFPELADRCSFEAASLFERRGMLARAARLYGAVRTGSYFFGEARLAQARVLQALGELDAAAAAVSPITISDVTAERRRALNERITLATLKHSDKERHEALAKLAAERAPWMGGAPVLAMISGSHDTLLRSTVCREARKAVWRIPAELTCLQSQLIAEAAACEGRDDTTELLRITRQCPELAPRAWMTIAMLEARASKAQDAATTFRHAAAVGPSGALAGDATFAAFWVEWKSHASSSTAGDLARLETLPVRLSAQDRARIGYWRARVAEAHGDSAEETNVLAELALRYPATFYGSLAREKLTSMKASISPAVELTGLMQQDDALDERDALERLTPAIVAIRLGRDDAVAELTTTALRHPSPAANRITVEVLEATGATLPAYRFARTVFRAQPGDREEAAVWEAAFPTHFSDLIALNAGKANVTAPLLQGLVREESAFEPSARSRCGALGLMQLMPVTARALSREEGGALENTGELLDPKLNVHLGSRYFGQLLRRFDGNRIAATAAYNGGPTRVAGWMKLSNARQSDEWLEELPLDETRNYVKDVLASADVYRYRLADRAFGLASVVP